MLRETALDLVLMSPRMWTATNAAKDAGGYIYMSDNYTIVASTSSAVPFKSFGFATL